MKQMKLDFLDIWVCFDRGQFIEQIDENIKDTIFLSISQN